MAIASRKSGTTMLAYQAWYQVVVANQPPRAKTYTAIAHDTYSDLLPADNVKDPEVVGDRQHQHANKQDAKPDGIVMFIGHVAVDDASHEQVGGEHLHGDVFDQLGQVIIRGDHGTPPGAAAAVARAATAGAAGAGPSGARAAGAGRLALGLPVLGRLALGLLALGRLALGLLALGRLALGLPVLGRLALGSQVLRRPVLHRPVLHRPAMGSPLLDPSVLESASTSG